MNAVALADRQPAVVVDTCTRESVVIEVDVSLGSDRVVRVLEQLRIARGLPERIVVDNGPVFQSKALDAGRTREE